LLATSFSARAAIGCFFRPSQVCASSGLVASRTSFSKRFLLTRPKYPSAVGCQWDHVGDFPFDVVGDPSKRIYSEFGIEPTVWALIHPRAWLPMARGIVQDAWSVLLGRKPFMRLRQEHGFLGVPADLLIGPDGPVLATKYGTYNFDQWSVSELLAQARKVAAPAKVEA
jgi:hypothetical protein